MRALRVVLVPKRIEALLLGADGCSWWLRGGFVERAVEALVATVLTGSAGVDALRGDAQLDPPHRQLRQPTGANAGERRAIVGAQVQRQAVLTKRCVEDWPHIPRLDPVVQRLTAQQETAVRIGDGQRITPHAITGAEPALEVGTPRVVGCADAAERLRPRWHMPAWSTAFDHQPGTRQDRPARAGHWPLRLDQLRLVLERPEFLGSPARMACLGPNDRGTHVLADGIGVLVWRSRPRLQPVESVGCVVGKQCISRLATDAEAAAQLSHAALVLEPLHHKGQTLLHGRDFLPEHGP